MWCVHSTETATTLWQRRYGTAARTRITETVTETDTDERKRNAGNQA